MNNPLMEILMEKAVKYQEMHSLLQKEKQLFYFRKIYQATKLIFNHRSRSVTGIIYRRVSFGEECIFEAMEITYMGWWTSASVTKERGKYKSDIEWHENLILFNCKMAVYILVSKAQKNLLLFGMIFFSFMKTTVLTRLWSWGNHHRTCGNPFLQNAHVNENNEI